MNRVKKTIIAVLAAVVGAAGFVTTAPAPQAAANVDVYTTPGNHTVNGRQWRTSCEKYTSTIDRCRAEIWATQITIRGGKYVQENGFVFNNLTYKASPRAQWGNNPLANTGQWTSADGRQWKTSCGDSWTGPNGCRSFIMTTVISSAINEKTGNRDYFQYQDWVFNNVVQFTAGGAAPAPKPSTSVKPPATSVPGGNSNATLGVNAAKVRQYASASCSGTIPAGYLVSAAGVPYSPAAPYTPKDSINPITLSNFNSAVRNSTQLNSSQKLCWARKSAAILVNTSKTQKSPDGNTARFFQYDFPFQANPSTTAMGRGWVSGLGQGSAIGSLHGTAALTGEKFWDEFAQEAYESFFVPIEKGGFTSWKTGELWFEEYPSNPPTTVLNGMNYATIGFVNWTNKTNDARGKAMYDDIRAAYKKFLPMFTIDDEGGTLATYDLVRGMKDARPLRIVPVSAGAKVTSVDVHGKTYRPGAATQLAAAPELVTNGGMNGTAGWNIIGRQVAFTGGIVRVVPGLNAWQGVNQTIPAAKFGDRARKVSLQFDMRRIEPAKGGNVSSKVTVFQNCAGKSTALLQTEVPRGDKWGTYTYEMNAPAAGCNMVVQFLGNSLAGDGTILEYDNVSVRYSDWVGAGSFIPAYDHYVWRTPTSQALLKGSGTVQLQYYEGGRWKPMVQVVISAQGRSWTIPERLTGRNINYKYHDHHPYEMVALYRALGDKMFLDYANKWDTMALGYKVP